MFINTNGRGSLAKHIRKEVIFDGDVERGARGQTARRVQEWLRFHGARAVKVDGQFGGITEEAVAAFQLQNDLAPSGIVDESTFECLIAPMLHTLEPPLGPIDGFSDAVAAFAEQHYSMRPFEIGGDNRGPWVRLYHRGGHGKKFLWCAGFVTLCIQQAAELFELPMPIEGTFNCDRLSQQGKDAGLFLSERDATPDDLARGSIFLKRKPKKPNKGTDWFHVGVVTSASENTFNTVEGNTNGKKSSNGGEVAAHARRYPRIDFIVFE